MIEDWGMRYSAHSIVAILSAALITTAFSAESYAQGGDWPMWRHDGQRVARQTVAGELDEPAVRWTIPVGGNHPPNRLILSDVNLDGVVEAIMIRGGRVVARQPDGTLIWASDPIGAGWLLSALDFDASGRPEVFASSLYDGVFAIDGTTGAIVWRTPVREARHMNDSFALDVDGDGRLELYVPDRGTSMSGRGTGRVYSFPGGLSAPFEEVELDVTDHGYWGGRTHDVGDLDGDGSIEVVTLAHSQVIVYNLVTGAPIYTSEDLGEFPYGIGEVTVADVDGDELDEVVVASNNPGGRFAASRRLLLLEVEDAALSLRWSVEVDSAQGNHCFPRRPVADIIPGGALEIATSIYDPSTGWRLLVYSGDAATAAPVLELARAVLLAVSDLDGDGVAELIIQEGSEIVRPPFGTVRALYATGGSPTELGELWAVEEADLPIEQGPWYSWNGPVRLGSTEDSTRPTLLRRDLDGDERPDEVVAVDSTGAIVASRSFGTRSIGALRSCEAGCQAVVVRYDGSLEVIGTNLAMTNDFDPPIGVADLVEANHLGSRAIVTTTSVGPLTVVTDASGALRAYEVSGAALDERWASSDLTVVSATATMALPVAAFVEPMLGVAARRVGGGIDLRLYEALDASPLGATKVTTSREAYVYKGFTPLRGPSGFVEAVVTGMRDRRDDEVSYLHVEVPGGTSTLLPLSWVSTGSGDGLSAAFDLTGDNNDDILVVQGRDAHAVDGVTHELLQERESLEQGARWSGLSVIDVDDDGTEDILASEGPAVALLDQTFELMWESEQREGGLVMGATAPVGGETVIGSPGRADSILNILAGRDGSLIQSLCLAGGAIWANEEEARAAGIRPGALTNVITSRNLTGHGHWSFLVGSTDGWLYVVSADDGTLDWVLNLRAAVTEPIVADVDGDGLSEVVIAVGDGTIQVLDRASLPAPGAVFDTDGTYVAEGPEDDLDELPTGRTAGASWFPVEGATSYEHQLLLDNDVVVVPWTDVGPATDVRYNGLALPLGRHYSTVVRARSVDGPSGQNSEEVASDGFIVVDPHPPTVVVDAAPNPFHPESASPDAFTTIHLQLADEVGLRRYYVEISGPDGSHVHSFGPFEIGGTSFLQDHEWEGRNSEGGLVETGWYSVVATVEDGAGNVGTGSDEVYACTSLGVDVGGLCEEPLSDADVDSEFDADVDVASESTQWQARGGFCDCSAAHARSTSGGLQALLNVLGIRGTPLDR